jgi:hypothetical protein
MGKKNRRGAADDSRWEYSPRDWCVALLPFRIGTRKVRAGTGYGGGNLAANVECGQPVPITGDTDEAEQKRFFEALLELGWITPEFRRAVLKALGCRQRDENQAYERGRTLAIRKLIEERVALKRNGERPAYEKAVAEIAHEQGMTVAALKGRLLKKRLIKKIR